MYRWYRGAHIVWLSRHGRTVLARHNMVWWCGLACFLCSMSACCGMGLADALQHIALDGGGMTCTVCGLKLR